HYTGIMVSADQYWYNTFISKYKPNDHDEVRIAAAGHANNPINREFSAAEFDAINPYSLGDPIKFEKSHFALASNPSSPGIRYMADLTRALVASIQALALSSGSDFGAFWYDASKTKQPLYPKDGIYNVHNIDLQISSSAMLQRLATIFAGVNHAAILLELPEW